MHYIFVHITNTVQPTGKELPYICVQLNVNKLYRAKTLFGNRYWVADSCTCGLKFLDQRSINMHTRVHKWALNWAKWVRSTLSNKSQSNIALKCISMGSATLLYICFSSVWSWMELNETHIFCFVHVFRIKRSRRKVSNMYKTLDGKPVRKTKWDTYG